MRIIVYIFLLLFIFSCNNVRNNNEIPKINIYHYYINFSDLDNKFLRDSTTTYIHKKTLYNKEYFLYSYSKEYDSIFRYLYSIENDSFFFNNTYSKTLDTFKLNFKNKPIEIYKNIFDEDCCEDEESNIYWNEKYGLLCIDNYAMNVLITFEHEELIGFADKKLYDFLIGQKKELKKELNSE